MEQYINDNRDSWAMMQDNSTSFTFETSSLSGPEQSWGVREWLISVTFVVVVVVILFRPTADDTEEEDSSQESSENENPPVKKKKRIDEEARRANILNLFRSKHIQQVRNDMTGGSRNESIFLDTHTLNLTITFSGNNF